MLGLAEYEASLCGCGLPKHLADEDPDLQLTHRVCPVCAGLAVAARVQNKADEHKVAALGKSPAPDVARPADGRYLGIEAKAPEPLDRPGAG